MKPTADGSELDASFNSSTHSVASYKHIQFRFYPSMHLHLERGRKRIGMIEDLIDLLDLFDLRNGMET